MISLRRGPTRIAGAVLVAGLVLGACGSEDPAAGSPSGSTTPAEATVLATVPATSVPAPVAIVGVYDGVEAYPACGNEPFDHDGVTWYPLFTDGYESVDPDLQPKVDEVLAVEREPAPEGEPQGLARVAPPGPGDDIGTLVVWADGVARWMSDSGNLDVWLVDDVITYNWVC